MSPSFNTRHSNDQLKRKPFRSPITILIISSCMNAWSPPQDESVTSVFPPHAHPLVSLMSHNAVTGESPPSLSKELTNSLAGVGDVSFDADSQFPLDELKIDPLTLDGLHMLNDPDMVLADPATEDTFRMDRL